ncbi:hypothetical protein DN730_07065 [Marinomonas piezotolerans]|uniref:Uncharacterized protein n=1 Tax=Marinomonas piezotolerans TaxID=2213058 RepID=A0A370UC38_9GAMM|nr:hypothetical protein [Marinomonas piezotolerans]RDL45362.1 hypothetical protein DN730_07065 [Marinomonas piezotolerans]
MPKYTVLTREHLIRAESDEETIERFKRCGYQSVAEYETTTAGGALGQYREEHASELNTTPPKMSPRMRKALWFGGVGVVLWASYLIFGLLPLAFVNE